jgi:folate-binding protein YgfZ
MADITDEYRTITSGAGWIDRSRRGRLRFQGGDVLSFLQALITNDVASLTPGRGAYAAYLTPNGRMITDLELHGGPDGVMAHVSPGMAADLASRFDQLIFTEDVRVEDVSERTSEIRVVGGAAAAVIAEALAVDQEDLDRLAEPDHAEWSGGFVARSGGADLPAFTIVAPSDRLHVVVASLEAAGAIEMSEALDEGMRIEAGRPEFGVDMTTDTLPLEAGLLDRSISTTKGCYVGQEIVIRVLHRGGGRVARRLVTIALSEAAMPPAPGAALRVGDREVGRVTSAARSPRTETPIAMGYVHRDAAVIDQPLVAGDGLAGVVTGFAR